MLPFTIHLDTDGVPVSDQILQSIRKGILMRQIRPGDEFPSVRTLSQELRISPTTAHKVVATLKNAGYLTSRPGIGMVVALPDLPTREERKELIKPLCESLLKEAWELELKLEDVVETVREVSKHSKLP